MERTGYFLSGPIERGALSGPLDPNLSANPVGGGGGGPDGRVHFSAPLGGLYGKKRRKKGISGIRKALYRNFSVVPVLNFVGRKEVAAPSNGEELEPKNNNEANVQWALGKAGEDRVHVVVSEEQGWLFVGIYDGFNGPDAPEFLMGNLYRAFYNELQGLFWEPEPETEPEEELNNNSSNNPPNVGSESQVVVDVPLPPEADRTKRVTFQSDGGGGGRRRRLWELLAEAEAEEGLDLSGSERFAFSVDDALTVSNEGSGSAVSRRWLLLSKLKQGLLSKHKEGPGQGQGHSRKLFPWRFGLENKEKVEVENIVEEEERLCAPTGRKRKEGPVDHELVLSALSKALQVTEDAYLDMTDKVLDTNPELALMGSCLLVVLMRDEDVYVMNLGDSRAIVAHYEMQEEGGGSSTVESRADKGNNNNNNGLNAEDITEDSS